MALLRLSLLGGFEAELVSGTPVVLPTKKAQALVAYCALRSTQAHQREKLATLLWGETAEANARNSLRQTLHVLRSALGESVTRILRIDRDAVGADPHAIDVDVLRFEQLTGQQTPQALEQAAALYRGDLLDGFVVDEEPFEEWLLGERERLRDLAMEALARLLQHQRVEGMTRAAIHTARRLLALDPLQEIVHRLLMRLLLQIGRPDEALNQYEVCKRVLKRELNVEPEVETVKLRDSIVAELRTASADQSRDSVRPRAVQSAIPAPVIENAPEESGRNGAGRPLLDQARDQAPASAGLFARWIQAREEAQRLRAESREQRLMLHRAWRENYRNVIAVRRLVVSGGTLISAPGGRIII